MKLRSLISMFLLVGVMGNIHALELEIDNVKYTIVNGLASAIGYTEGIENANIVASVNYRGNDYAVTSIGVQAFYKCSGLKSVTFPSSLISIDHSAFYGCANLKSVVLPNGITSIGGSTFFGCSNLTSVTIPSSVTEVGSGAFWNCTSLTSVILPEGITVISGHLFAGCTGLISVTIPSSVTEIESYAFSKCSSLKSVTLPDKVAKIGKEAFFDCSNLISVTLSEGIRSVGERAFASCESLKSITFPSGITSIGSYAFGACTGLESIILPDKYMEIEKKAFAYCSSLKSITIPVTFIDEDTFLGCENLTSITLSSKIDGIQIYDRAFGDCPRIADIHCRTKVPPRIVNQSVFTNYDAIVYVPVGSKAAYDKAEYWKNFLDIVEEEETPIGMVEVKQVLHYADGVLSLPCPAEVSVYTPEGKSLLSRQEAEGECDLSSLSRGIYIIKVSADGNTTSLKIVK